MSALPVPCLVSWIAVPVALPTYCRSNCGNAFSNAGSMTQRIRSESLTSLVPLITNGVDPAGGGGDVHGGVPMVIVSAWVGAVRPRERAAASAVPNRATRRTIADFMLSNLSTGV